MASVSLNAYVLCIDTDGHSQINVKHDNNIFSDSGIAHDSLHGTSDDCLDRDLADTGISLKANNSSVNAPYFDFVLVVWINQSDLSITATQKQCRQHSVADHDFATLIKHTTTLLI